MPPHVVVINPNSTERLTDEIRQAVTAVSGASFDVVTSPDGPPAIESDQDVVDSVEPMLAVAGAHPADAYVVACFSDPGVSELRATGVRGFGIAESAVRTAIASGHRAGIVSSVDASIPRHDRHWERLGLAEHVSGDIAVGLGVLELHTDDAYERVRSAAQELVAGGAGAIVLGCTGMTHMVEPLAADLGVQVIDPCRAAAAMAVAATS